MATLIGSLMLSSSYSPGIKKARINIEQLTDAQRSDNHLKVVSTAKIIKTFHLC